MRKVLMEYIYNGTYVTQQVSLSHEFILVIRPYLIHPINITTVR